MVMNKEIRLKSVIFYSVILLITILIIDIYFEPRKYINLEFVHTKIEKISSMQKIAPGRLFVNVWRTAKNEYVDNSMNGQNWMKWRIRYLKHIKTSDDAFVAINSMLASLNDPYTKFLKTDTYIKQQEILDSKITGIGIIINKTNENITINHVLNNSPAQKNHILPGDKLISINGQNVKNIDIDKIIASGLDDKEQFIKIKIKRADKIIEKTIKKTKIPIKTMEYKIIDNNIALVTLATIMGEDTLEDFKNILEKTNESNGIILDLRNNYGGILYNAIEMANYMLYDEKIVNIESNGNNRLQIYASKEKIFKDKPLVILVNRRTASAAEILAGTLKDNLGAVIIGENTYGKNSIQQIIPMPDKTGLIITTDRYILPAGEDIHNKGIYPDIYLKHRFHKNKKDKQIEEAVRIINEMVKKT